MTEPAQRAETERAVRIVKKALRDYACGPEQRHLICCQAHAALATLEEAEQSDGTEKR